MNIYHLFRLASKRSTLNRNKMLEIWRNHCPEVPLYLIEAHRKIYHQQLWLSYYRPLDPDARDADVGNYIDQYGNIKATKTRPKSEGAWTYFGTYTLKDQSNKSALAHKYRTNKDFADVLDIFSNKRLNPIFINELTIPKWEPRSKTICMDIRTEFNKNVERLLKYNELVLRCTPLGDNQYDLWTLSRKNKVFHRRVATIVGDSIGLGKTKNGSKRSGAIKNAHKITATLSI